MISTEETGNEKHAQAMAELAKAHNKEDNLRKIESQVRLIQDILTKIYGFNADSFLHHFLKGRVDFKINEHLTFRPGQIIITIGERQRYFDLVARKDLNTKLLGLMASNYKFRDIMKLYFVKGIKEIAIPESALSSRQSLNRNVKEENLFFLEKDANENMVVIETDYSMEYQPLESAIRELLVEINKDILETKEELKNPFLNIGSQVDAAAIKLMDEADIRPEDRRNHYEQVVKKAEVVKKKRN